MVGSVLFLAELDDEFQDLTGLTEKDLIRRAYCYFLLADGLLIHPAYLWQSHLTNELVRVRLAEIFRPPWTSVVLGDSQDIPDYMMSRMGRLDSYRCRQTTEELGKYLHWDTTLLRQAQTMDGQFGAASRLKMSESRDARFRRLIGDDLRTELDPASLIALIRSHIHDRRLGIDLDIKLEQLHAWVISSPMVSVETISSRVRDSFGMNRLVESMAFKKRLLRLYYLANVEEGGVVAGIGGLTGLIDPYDADVFWVVFSRLFGKKVGRVFSTGSDPSTVKAILELKQHDLWDTYRRIYFEVMNAIESSLRGNTAELRARLRERTGECDVVILRRLWREQKYSIISAVFGIIGLFSGGAFWTAVGTVSVLSGTLGSGGLLSSIKRFIHEYHAHDMTRLRHLIDEKVRAIC